MDNIFFYYYIRVSQNFAKARFGEGPVVRTKGEEAKEKKEKKKEKKEKRKLKNPKRKQRNEIPWLSGKIPLPLSCVRYNRPLSK